MAPTPAHFFKPLMPGFKDRLKLPVAFTGSLNCKSRKLDKALLKSCLGSWFVRVGRSDEGALSFEGDWKEFVRHHRLQLGDFLVFEHKGNMKFDVVSYEPLGSEKEYPPPTWRANSRMAPSTSRDAPFFTKLMSPTHAIPCKGYVTIPKEFVTSNGLRGKSSMILRTSGKQWQVGIGLWQGGGSDNLACLRTAIRAKGWHEFYRDNNLKNGDVCTFKLREVPKSNSKPVIMDVKISRT